MVHDWFMILMNSCILNLLNPVWSVLHLGILMLKLFKRFFFQVQRLALGSATQLGTPTLNACSAWERLGLSVKRSSQALRCLKELTHFDTFDTWQLHTTTLHPKVFISPALFESLRCLSDSDFSTSGTAFRLHAEARVIKHVDAERSYRQKNSVHPEWSSM